MEHLKKKRLQNTEGDPVLPPPPTPTPKRAGHDGKRLLIDTGSLQKILNICHALLFVLFFAFWLKNECCPVVLKKERFFVLIAQALDCVGFIHFFFFVPWTLLGKSLLKEA